MLYLCPVILKAFIFSEKSKIKLPEKSSFTAKHKLKYMNIPDLYERDLNKLIEELNQFKREKDIWKVKGDIKNSAGNLTLHLLGNLNHFIGRTLAHTDFIRKREDEFSLKDIPREQLVSQIKSLKEVLKNTLPNLTDEDLKKQFPLKIGEQEFSTETLLIFLLTHLNYHLGQINYLRRML